MFLQLGLQLVRTVSLDSQCAKLLHPDVCLYTSVHIATTQTTTVVVCLFIAVMLMSRLIRTQSQKFNSMKLKLLISFKETFF